MAPKGFRNFTAETLASDDLDGYCAWQSVMVFASSSARSGDSGLTANAREGMVSYLEDIDTVQFYNGSAWVNLIPAGTINPWAGDDSSIPSGWLLCDGTAVSRTTYAGLFAAVGTAFGVGDGSTTFNVPNLKGRVPVGRDSSQSEFNARGETGGAKTHTLTTAQMPTHSHTVAFNLDNAGTNTNEGLASSAGADVQITNTATTTAGSGEAHPNLQPYIVLAYLIKV